MLLHIFAFMAAFLIVETNASDLYPSYTITVDPKKMLEWSNDRALAYVTTVRLFDYDHHIFQYRRYPCQYFYTDEIQVHYENDSMQQCVYNTSTVDYEYRFQLHLDSRHVEPFILRNLALNCIYINCTLSQLNIKYLEIDWNTEGRIQNPECTFDANRPYAILNTPYTISEWIKVRCKSLSACETAKNNLEHSFTAMTNLTYGSSYELEHPYCSLQKNLGHMIETNLAETNRLLQQLVELIQRGFGTPNEREQARMRDYVEKLTGNDESTATAGNTRRKRNSLDSP